MGLPRIHLNAVLLPDRTVFVSGGSLKQEDRTPGPAAGGDLRSRDRHWPYAAATVPRLYHSTAVLLPDGRVVAAGGNPEGGSQVAWIPAGPGGGDAAGGVQPAVPVQGPPPDDHRGTRPKPPTARHVTIDTPQAPTIRGSPSSATASPPTPSTASSDWSTSRSPARRRPPSR